MAEECSYTAVGQLDVFFRPVDPSDLERVHQLESASYPPDEAATYDKLKYRIENAANVFMVAVQNDQIVGFICGTCANGSKLTHESMSKHGEAHAVSKYV